MTPSSKVVMMVSFGVDVVFASDEYDAITSDVCLNEASFMDTGVDLA